jgi:fibronectin-binding autotransporter adhesin
MRTQAIRKVLFTSAGVALAGIGSRANALTPTGTLNSTVYGAPLATQTVNTGFGDSTAGDGTSGGGSELDALYANASAGYLNVFLSGNFESNGNHVNLFIADGRAGQSVLNANGSPLNGANGLTFPTGFSATYAIDGNDYQGTFYFDTFDLVANSSNYAGAISLTNGVGSGSLAGFSAGINNINAAGVNGSTGTAASATDADAVTTGLELQIPLSALGNPTGSLQVMADINGGGDSYLSNQFLPGLPVGDGNLGSPASVNLSNASGGVGLVPATVPLPAAVSNGTWLPATGGNWNSSSNWANGIVPNSASATATFASATNDSNVALNGQFTVGTIVFNSAFAYTISAGTGGTLMLGNSSSGAAITSYSGNQTISAPIVLNSTTFVNAVARGATITLSGNISGPGGLATADPGAYGSTPSNIILSGSNTYSGGTNVSAGNLTLGSATALPAGSALTLSAQDVPAGVLDLNGYSASVSSITILTGSKTGPTGANAQIINTSTTPGAVTLTYAGNASNPSVFLGTIADSAATGGSITNVLVASGSLTFSGNNSYGGMTTVNGGSTLTLASAGALPGGTNLSIGSASAVIVSNLGTEFAVTVNSLSVVGKLDLNNNGLIIHNTSLGAVTAMLHNGYNGGQWNGSTGIGSTTAATDSTHLTALGVILNNVDGSTPLYGEGDTYGDFIGLSPAATDVLVKYTYYGDTNLDGVVDGSDYSRIDAAYLNNLNSSNASLTGWFNGDFNYDGVVDGSDYTLIDNAFNQQGASLASAVATAQVGGSSAVPEPTSLGLLGTGVAGLLVRRRHRAASNKGR